MVAKKSTTKSKPKAAKAAEEVVVPVEEQTVDAMEAAVIASLVQQGIPYAEAKAQVLGKGPAPAQEEPKDIEPPVVPQKSQDFSEDQVALYNEVVKIKDGEGKPSYKVTIELPQIVFDWTARRTLQTAAERNNPNFLLQEFMILLLKEQRMLDPTKGGTISAVSSGPKDMYNPQTEKWA